jgi:hypothetical protein
MQYDKLSIASLKDMHDSIKRCLDEDDATQKGKAKRYWGVREYPDWKEQLDKIEAELTKRSQTFTPIELKPQSAQAGVPKEWVLYERIRACLAYEDELSPDIERPYGVRQHSDWRKQAEQFESVLDKIGYSYKKIQWEKQLS